MGINMLWADDDPEEHALMTRVLDKCEGKIALAACRTGREALSLATGKLGLCPRLDFVLVDLIMPGMDGFDLLVELKKEPTTRLLPVIVYSVSDSPQNVVRAYELGAAFYCIKPSGFSGACEFMGLLEKFCGFVSPARAS